MPGKLGLHTKDIQITHNFYEVQISCIWIGKELDESTKNKMMCVTLDLFNVYSKVFLRGLEDTRGFIIGEQDVKNIFHTDEDMERKLKELLDKLDDKSKNK